LKFAGNNDFQIEVRRRIDEFFRSTGRRQRDCPQMYLKTAILLACFSASYVLLVFMAQTLWQALPLAVLLGLTTAAIGFNIQHDGGHHAYSNHARVNRLMARTLDIIGGSSYQWHWKHAIFHLFPRICHVNYPAISKLVEQTCREFGVKYHEHASFWTGVRS
jgi:linoleoyl-CoA desaturase